jgi:hypothetical protein
MPRVGLEPTTPVFKRAKTIHALELAITVIVCIIYLCGKITTHSPLYLHVFVVAYFIMSRKEMIHCGNVDAGVYFEIAVATGEKAWQCR